MTSLPADFPEPRRLTLVVGAYGSGKSEVSINYALALRAAGYRVTLCDLDTINPYYRSADARESLEKAGVRMIAPRFAGTNVDVPAVPDDIASAFDDVSSYAVLDIGGEDLGARVVASLKPRILTAGTDRAVWMTVNPNRPFTSDAARILRVQAELEEAMGLPVDGYVLNANLMEDRVDPLVVLHGLDVLGKVSEHSGKPILFLTWLADDEPMAGTAASTFPILSLRRYLGWQP